MEDISHVDVTDTLWGYARAGNGLLDCGCAELGRCDGGEGAIEDAGWCPDGGNDVGILNFLSSRCGGGEMAVDSGNSLRYTHLGGYGELAGGADGAAEC